MHRTRSAVTAALLFLLSASALADIRTERVAYQDGDVALNGYLAWDDAVTGKRPGVLVVHEWWGLDEYAERRTRMLAELGYVAFAADLYGGGRSTSHPEEAGAWAKEITANVQAWQQRADKGLDVLRNHELVDASRLGAIGYCLGGATVVQMAYANSGLAAAVSFHGSLPLPDASVAGPLATRILIAHGAADGFIAQDHVTRFQEALESLQADWQMIIYGGAQHSFTNPAADGRGMKFIKYDPVADRRSWQAMRTFLEEAFGTAPP